jgi:DNA adenine methylase
LPTLKSLISPLRYPGSKAALTGYISDLIHENYLDQCVFIEPYAGSAIVSLDLLHRGVISRAVLIERDPLLFSFWHSVFKNPHELIEQIDILPITMSTWNKFQKYRISDSLSDYPLIEMGLAGLFFNRTTFSGIMKAGPLGGISQRSQYKIDCRFNKNRIIKQIFDISQYSAQIDIQFEDALDFMIAHKTKFRKDNCFIYVDPPYYAKGESLYRYWYTHDNHKQLAQYLMKLDSPWLASYDDHAAIRKLYENVPGLQEIYLDYSVANCRREQELLLSNLQIPPFKQQLMQMSLA